MGKRELCEDHQWVMRRKDGGKSRGKQPQWDEGRCLCFTLMHKTITSREPRSTSICLSGKGKKNKRSGGGRKREREKCWKIVLTHTGQSPARSQTKKDNKDGKVFTVKGPGSSDVIITRTLAEPEHGKSKNQTCCLFMPEKDLRRWTLLSTHIHKQGPVYWWSL